MRDQLPEYVHGVLSADAAARVDAHLAQCEDCRAEAALLGRVRAALSQGTPVVNVAAIVAALTAPPIVARRGAASPATARRAPRRFAVTAAWQYVAAAALVLAVGSTALWRAAPEPVGQRVADSSSAAVVPGNRTAVPAATPVSVQLENGMTFGGGLSDLSLNDLESLLGQMDSVRTLPSSNPESMTPVITVKEGGKSL
jgi:anti-sigma factor RsiW